MQTKPVKSVHKQRYSNYTRTSRERRAASQGSEIRRGKAWSRGEEAGHLSDELNVFGYFDGCTGLGGNLQADERRCACEQML